MEPSLPTARGLAIAGEWIAGGVGTHETALASPERVDLGGRCVLPGFTDSHVHFPTWAMAQREVRLEDTSSLDEALTRVRAALPNVRPGRSEEHTSELQSLTNLVCRLLLEKKNTH